MAKMNWDKEESVSRDDTKGEDTPVQEERNKRINENLTIEEMKKLRNQYTRDNPEDIVQPIIIPTLPAGSTRFYIIKALTMPDMDKMNEIFALFLQEEVTKVKDGATKAWKESIGLKDSDAIPETKMSELETYQATALVAADETITKRANDRAVNMTGVLWPEDHNETLGRNQVPSGDVHNIASCIQIASGWSQSESDIEVYEDAIIEGMKRGFAAQVAQGADIDKLYESLEEQ